MILSFSYSNNTFFIKHMVKFKYQPCHLKGKVMHVLITFLKLQASPSC